MGYILFTHSSVDIQQGCLCILGIVNKTVINMDVHVSLRYADLHSLLHVPNSGIAGSNGCCPFSYFRNSHTDQPN
jgi:hypothetical protein